MLLTRVFFFFAWCSRNQERFPIYCYCRLCNGGNAFFLYLGVKLVILILFQSLFRFKPDTQTERESITSIGHPSFHKTFPYRYRRYTRHGVQRQNSFLKLFNLRFARSLFHFEYQTPLIVPAELLLDVAAARTEFRNVKGGTTDLSRVILYATRSAARLSDTVIIRFVNEGALLPPLFVSCWFAFARTKPRKLANPIQALRSI